MRKGEIKLNQRHLCFFYNYVSKVECNIHTRIKRKIIIIIKKRKGDSTRSTSSVGSRTNRERKEIKLLTYDEWETREKKKTWRARRETVCVLVFTVN